MTVNESPYIEQERVIEGSRQPAEAQRNLDDLWREFLGPQMESEFSDLIRRLKNIEGIKPEEWEKLSPKEREEVIKRVHREIARAYHFPEAKVSAVDLPPKTYGSTSRRGDRIYINRSLLERKDPREAVDTILHESRHAYQFYAIQHAWKFSSERRQEIEKWRKNWNNYRDPTRWGFPEYWYQPVEVDARTFAQEARQQLGL